MSNDTETKFFPSEKPLPDDYPVHYDYCYLADGKVIFSNIGDGATVRHLKADTGASEIRNVDLKARNLL